MIIADTCALINLHNCGMLELALAGAQGLVRVGPSVIGECDPALVGSLIACRRNGLLDLLDDSSISSVRFMDIQSNFAIGDGETECIAMAEFHNAQICCDDKKARRVATQLLGPQRVMGSLRLLQMAVSSDLCEPQAAFDGYLQMKVCGGFLPVVELAYFAVRSPLA